MRYFLVNYYRRPNGQMDEVVSIAKRTRTRDLQTCAVILDFKTRSVVKCSLGDQIGVRDFQTVRGYYHQHYKQVIQGLEQTFEDKSDHTG
jgi:hypothetical protein